MIAAGTQIEDAINNGTIKNMDPPRFKKNLGSNSKTIEVYNIYKNDPYQLIDPRREFFELYMLMSQVFEKLKAKGLLKPLDPRQIPNPLPARFDDVPTIKILAMTLTSVLAFVMQFKI